MINEEMDKKGMMGVDVPSRNQSMNADEADEPEVDDNPEEEGQEPEEGGKFKSGVDKSIPPQFMDAFERIVLAGMKVMYSKDMAPEVRKEMAKQVPMQKKIGEAIGGLMSVLLRNAKGKVPGEVVIPAAIELAYEFADFMSESGIKVTPEDKRMGSLYAATIVAKMIGIPDQQIQQMLQGQAPQAPEQEDQETPEQQPQQPQQPQPGM